MFVVGGAAPDLGTDDNRPLCSSTYCCYVCPYHCVMSDDYWLHMVSYFYVLRTTTHRARQKYGFGRVVTYYIRNKELVELVVGISCLSRFWRFSHKPLVEARYWPHSEEIVTSNLPLYIGLGNTFVLVRSIIQNETTFRKSNVYTNSYDAGFLDWIP